MKDLPSKDHKLSSLTFLIENVERTVIVGRSVGMPPPPPPGKITLKISIFVLSRTKSKLILASIFY